MTCIASGADLRGLFLQHFGLRSSSQACHAACVSKGARGTFNYQDEYESIDVPSVNAAALTGDFFADICKEIDNELAMPRKSHNHATLIWLRFHEATRLHGFSSFIQETQFLREPGTSADLLQVILNKQSQGTYGFGLHNLPGDHAGILVIDEIVVGGVLDCANRECRAQDGRRHVVHPFAVITSVNGISEDSDLMMTSLREDEEVRLAVANPRCLSDVVIVQRLIGGVTISHPFWLGALPVQGC